MDFVISYILPIISAIIATASIVLSVKVYRRDMPKLQIDIDNPKYDCFFGDVATEDKSESLHENRISGVRFTLRNNSSADIEVNGIALEINSEMFRLIPSNNPYWGIVYFYTYDSDERKMVPDYTYGISYSGEGICLPLMVRSYTSFSCCALFYSFPTTITGQVNAILHVKTAIGVRKKKITLLEYDNTFGRQEWEEVEQGFRSSGGHK